VTCTSFPEDNQKTINGLTDAVGKENVYEVSTPKPRKAYVRINVGKLRDAVTYLKEKEGFYHLATITGLDLGEEIEIIYHLDRPGLLLSLKTRVPSNKPVVPSITEIINGATLYEREVNDLLGVFPEGHPDPKRLMHTEEWPDGVHPLLKKWDIKSLRKTVDGEDWT